VIFPLIPFLGAVLEATGTIYEKTILRVKKISIKSYNTFSFLVVTLIAFAILMIFGKIFPSLFSLAMNPAMFSSKNLLLFAGVVIFSIAANLCLFYAIKWDKLTELEPIILFQPFLTIVLAFIFYESERQLGTNIILAALIASLALILSHIKKHHLSFDKYSIAALLSGLFFAIELVISKQLLPYFSPLGFYFVRCLFIFIISFIIFRPNISTLNKKIWAGITIASAIWVVYRILLYLGFIYSGVILTTVMLSLVTPIFIYIFSALFLKEKLTWRNILATMIILACVIYVAINSM